MPDIKIKGRLVPSFDEGLCPLGRAMRAQFTQSILPKMKA
jgi:hypothetical protein